MAEAAREYLAGRVSFDQFVASLPEDADADIAALIDLVEHEPAVRGFLGVGPAKHEQHISEIRAAILRLESNSTNDG